MSLTMYTQNETYDRFICDGRLEFQIVFIPSVNRSSGEGYLLFDITSIPTKWEYWQVYTDHRDPVQPTNFTFRLYWHTENIETIIQN